MAKTIKFEVEKVVKHSVRYKEITEDGASPIVGSIYVQKWFAGDAKELTITIEKPDMMPQVLDLGHRYPADKSAKTKDSE